MSAEESKEQSLFQNLLQRHVIQSVGLYVAAAWGVVEILLTLQDTLGWPAWIAKVVLALFIAGFPVVLGLSWYRDLQSRWARLGVSGGALAIAGFALWTVLATPPPEPLYSGPLIDSASTVVVAPFDIRGDETSESYLSRGFTGELIARLSKDPRLSVIQQESLSSPVVASLTPTFLAREVGADHVVEGGIRREGDFIEVQVWLRNSAGEVQYSDTLREPYSAIAIAEMQRRISSEVSRALGSTLDGDSYCGDTTDLDAMELYFQGRSEVGMRVAERIEAGIDFLKEAVERDPYYGRAWNQLGEAYSVLPAMMDNSEGQADARRRTTAPMARRAFQRALDICPRLGLAYKMLVPDYDVPNRWIGSEMEFRDATSMDPNDSSLLRAYMRFLLATGRMSEAARIGRRAYDNDPLVANIIGRYANALYFAGRCEEALPLAEEAQSLRGRGGRMVIENCAVEAARARGEDTELPPEEEEKLLAQARALWEMPASERPRGAMNRIVFTFIAGRDFDLAFDALNSVARYGSWDNAIAGGYENIWYPLEPFDEFRSDPRFAELMKTVGLDEYWTEYGYPDFCAPADDGFRCGARQTSM